MRASEKLITTDIKNYLSKVQKFLGKDEARERQFQRYNSIFEDLTRKWDKNKTEYKANAKLSNAVIVANSLG
jgi:transposase